MTCSRRVMGHSRNETMTMPANVCSAITLKAASQNKCFEFGTRREGVASELDALIFLRRL